MTALSLTLIGIAALVGTVAGRLGNRAGLVGRLAPFAAALALAGAALAASTAPPVHGFALAATYVLTVAAAATGGAPMVLAAFRFARKQPDAGPEPDDGPLRGGRVIGLLERTAVAVSILAGWPEGIAIVLAVKGLARYPELREPHASEQFIIGTFTSVLWAVAVAGVGRALVT
ncbi:hypothetical protein [Prescottella agglutinans]|uniref:F0F1-type ATP synthase membrane subunit c/vacuolar-type H+-ATPase subunit K n=1 Tax=Prescottella agglutinans TaxID=1644129 RepID=A0ABT6MAE8_9NOCA|nr:hypothetical protein [Prescottella agglutinans]MDH6281272.1 F0F1-type ATP synthase membrane subunit c/vacuolar-type H+-ATPase subunit K [Prescottella agglutinans]